MQNELHFFIVFASVCCCVSGYKEPSCENYCPSGIIEYPCKTLDLDCIRHYLSWSGQCTPVWHKDGVPITVQSSVYAYVPRVNYATICDKDQIIFNGSELKAFYINRNTNTLVIIVDFKKIQIVSREAVSIFERCGEPLFISDHVNATYSVTLTGMFPLTPCRTQVRLEDATVSVCNKDPSPPLIFGPKVTNSKNQLVRETVKALLADTATTVKELFLTKRYYFLYEYLQHYLCDYGYEFNGRVN